MAYFCIFSFFIILSWDLDEFWRIIFIGQNISHSASTDFIGQKISISGRTDLINQKNLGGGPSQSFVDSLTRLGGLFLLLVPYFRSLSAAFKPL